MNNYRNKRLGKAGEDYVSNYLKNHGYEIIARNYRIRSAEIDIVAKLNETVVFTEVKTRSNYLHGLPAEAVDLRKQRKIIEAASVFLQNENYFEYSCRFDVIEVYSDGVAFKIRHIENAFEMNSEF